MNFDDISKGDEIEWYGDIVDRDTYASESHTMFIRKGSVVWEFEYCKDTDKWMALFRYVDEFLASSDTNYK